LKSNQSGDNKTAPVSAGLPNGNGEILRYSVAGKGLPGGRFSNQKIPFWVNF
jgi:hypothetical protein